MSKLQDYPYLSSISEDDKVLIVRNNDQGLAKISDLPIKGDVPEQLREEMNAVFNKKFGTAKTYPPKDWPDDVNLMGVLKEKTESGSIVYFEDGADDVPCKSVKVELPASVDGYSSVTIHQTDDQASPIFSKDYTVSLGRTIYGGEVDVVNGTGTDENDNPFTFDAQKISTRLGDNCFISDQGNIEVTYRSNGDAETPIIPTLVTKSIDSNGTYRAEDDNADGYSEVTVDIPSPTPPVLEEKTVTTNGTYRASDDDADGYSEVTVNVPASNLGAKTITQNGEYDPEDDNLDGYSGVKVNVPQATLGTKTITQNGTYQSSDDNADGYSSVVVNVSAANLDAKEITQNGIYIPQDDDLDGYSAVSVNVAEPTLIEKEITENGTYSASDDNADGYSEVTVNTPVRGDLLKMMENNSMNERLTLTDEALNSEATNIRQYAFYNCWFSHINLTHITSISSYAFYTSNGSNGVRTQIRLPNCKTIGEYAFKDYSRSDAAIDVLDLSNVETVAQYGFQRAKIWTKLVLPKCKSVGNNAFQECSFGGSGLEAPMLETIGERAFHSNYITPDVELPSVKTIANYAFDHTSSVNFTIGPNCTYIGNTIFGSAGVTNLYVLAETPPTLAGPFKSGNTGVQHIYVPNGCGEAYRTANVWSNYASIIEEISN